MFTRQSLPSGSETCRIPGEALRHLQQPTEQICHRSKVQLYHSSLSTVALAPDATNFPNTHTLATMSTERFVISQLEAHFAKDHDLIGKQDPYVVFELGSEKITTPAIKSGGLSCNWEESFTLIGRNNASDLTATVYNKNTLR